MRHTIDSASALFATFLAILSCGSAQTRPTLTTLYTFTNGAVADGVSIGSGGVLYGTTFCCEGGTVFSLSPPASPGGAWTQTVLYSFTGGVGNNGDGPESGVVIGSGGVLYGINSSGGGPANEGTVFSLSPPASSGGPWTMTVLHVFGGEGGAHDGGGPSGRLAIGRDGTIFGTTGSGGVGNAGTVYMLKPPASSGGSWTERILHRFTDFSSPLGGVTIGSGGVLYGTTERGGAFGGGTVFSLAPPEPSGGSWIETVLHDFAGGSDGATPKARVSIGTGGILYSTTQAGGTSSLGTVFQLTPPASPGGSWNETVLHSFAENEGTPVAGVTVDPVNGFLYLGTGDAGPLGSGAVFALVPPSSPGSPWTPRLLCSFDGLDPQGDLAIAPGVIYGTTFVDPGFPTVFSLTP